MKGSVEHLSQSHYFSGDKSACGQKKTQFVPVSFESLEAQPQLSGGLIKRTELIFPAGFCSSELLSQALAAYRKWHRIDDFGKTQASTEKGISSQPLVIGIRNEVLENVTTMSIPKTTLKKLEAKILSANIQYQTARLKVRFYGLKRDTDLEDIGIEDNSIEGVSACCHDWEIHKDLSEVTSPWCVVNMTAN